MEERAHRFGQPPAVAAAITKIAVKRSLDDQEVTAAKQARLLASRRAVVKAASLQQNLQQRRQQMIKQQQQPKVVDQPAEYVIKEPIMKLEVDDKPAGKADLMVISIEIRCTNLDYR